MSNHIVIFVTAKDKKEAEKIARGLLESKFIACANIVDGVKSLFYWRGKIDVSGEVLLIIKTKKALFHKVEGLVKSMHSYQTPEIISLSVDQGSQDYLNWIDVSLK